MIYPTTKLPPNHIPINKYDASRAVDGNTGTCMQSKAIGRNSPDTTVWWKVDLGEVYNIYCINIQFRNYDGYGLCFYNIYILFLLHIWFK